MKHPAALVHIRTLPGCDQHAEVDQPTDQRRLDVDVALGADAGERLAGGAAVEVTQHLDEQARLVRDLGERKAMILRNHGLLVCGASIAETFDLMYYLERACRIQVTALAGGAKLRLAPEPVAEKTARQFKGLPYKPKKTEWKALLRMLDKTDPSYRE